MRCTLFSEVRVGRIKIENERKIHGHVNLSLDGFTFYPCGFFVREYLLPHNLCDFLLPNIANIYVLWGHRSVEGFVNHGEKKWENILPPKLLAEIQKGNNTPLCFALIGKNPKQQEGSYVIEWIEELVMGHNLKSIMIHELNKKLSGIGIPIDINSDIEFWKEYLEDTWDDADDFWNFIKQEKIPTDLLNGYDENAIFDFSD